MFACKHQRQTFLVVAGLAVLALLLSPVLAAYAEWETTTRWSSSMP